MTRTRQVAVGVIGAGPYGLSVAAHLKAWDVSHALCGVPLARWAAELPRDFTLRSPAVASTIAGPKQGPSCTVADFRSACGATHPDAPMDGAEFLRYGHWYVARHDLAPLGTVEGIEVDSVFRLMVDGSVVCARAVVIATGLTHAAWVPDFARSLSGEVSCHSAKLGEVARYRGAQVVVVGGGQSGAAAIVARQAAGARPLWVSRSPPRFRELPWQGSRFAIAAYGASSAVLSTFPATLRDALCRAFEATVAKSWRKPLTGALAQGRWCPVIDATADGAGIRLTLADRSQLTADRVVWATGYRQAVTRDPIARALVDEQGRDAPWVDRTGRSRRAGVYFAGAWTVPRFGPAVRFLAGTWWQAPVIARAVARASNPTA